MSDTEMVEVGETPALPDPEVSPVVPIRTAGAAVGLSPNTAYARAAAGTLIPGVPIIRTGGRYVVPTALLRRALGLDA